MSTRAANPGRRRIAWTAVALFLAVWLNMAVQPCLMAAEPLLPAQHESGDCPHCPPVDHCGDAGRCGFIDGYNFDARQPALPDPEPVALLALPAPALALAASAAAPICVRPPDPGGLDPGPPRHLVFCRFLN
jgi:hypothetical protein